jgi:hypothetical protein
LIAAFAAFAFGAAPQWIASVWSLFSSEPLVPWLARHKVPTLPFSPLWVTGSISVILIAAIFFVVQRQNQPMVRTKTLEQGRSPQPIIVAIDELKALRYEGERLVGRFQEDSIKPTFPEVQDWRKRARDCARQNVLATESLVGAKDLLRLEKPWDEGDLLRIAAKFVDHGCLRADDSVGLAVFKHLWGSVERLKQLIAKIEGEEPKSRMDSGPRIITFDQESEIINLLKGVPLCPIWITTRMGSRENDKEAHDYAMQLTRVFMKAGVPIEGRASVEVRTLFPNGVSIFWRKAIYNDVTASSIIEAVRITGVECKEVDRQVCGSHEKEPEINLMIGSNEIKLLRA